MSFITFVVKYKLMSCSKKECCKQCSYVKFDGTMTKWPVQKLTHITTQKQVEHQKATDILKKTTTLFLLFFGVFFKGLALSRL